MISLNNVKRPQLLMAAAAVAALLLLSYTLYYRRVSLPSWVSATTKVFDPNRWQDRCLAPNPFEETFGRTNLRMTRAYEGSQFRVRQFLSKVMRGEATTIAAIGGSITKGHQVYESEIWFHIFTEWLREFFPRSEITSVNGAAPASGTDYFSFCFGLHIPSEADLVLVELAVNDEGIPEHVDDMENLLRGLLNLPQKPAVVLVEALAFSNGGMGGGGGRMHLPVAQYFDVPVINQRNPLAVHFARYPQLIEPYFSKDYWQNSDMRHMNRRGHHDLGMLVASFFQDVSCEIMDEPDVALAEESGADEGAEWPEFTRAWQNGEVMMPAMWNTPVELGLLPRLRTLDGWNSDLTAVVPAFHPICMSTRSQDPRFNLTPSAADGWEYWVHPEHLDKPYWLANSTGATISFELETSLGVIKMYSLRSRSFGFGTVSCWVDDDVARAVKAVGYWDNDANIGRFTSIAEHLAAGRHTVTCKVLDETEDPSGGHEFRIISVMSI